MVEDATPRMADPFGLPCYYVTDIVREDAGNGNMRIWNCVMKAGILMPVCEIIVPASRMMAIGMDASTFAQDLYRRETMAQIGQGMAFAH